MLPSTFEVSSLQQEYLYSCIFCCFEYSYISMFFHDSENDMPLMQENYVSAFIVVKNKIYWYEDSD